MRFRLAIVAILAIAFVSAAGYGVWNFVHTRQERACAACKRPVHQHSRTVAVAQGKEEFYCCPACALSERVQAGTRVQVTALTDHTTGAAIAPDRAWLVRGSDVNMCARTTVDPRPDKRPMEAHYDRCSPGLVAFSTETAANKFIREHGGHVFRFATLAAAR